MGGSTATGPTTQPVWSSAQLMCFLSVGKFQRCSGSHVVVVWVRGTVMRLWRKTGNCKSFLHNCAFVTLPGGHQAANKASTTWTELQEEVQQHYLEAERGTSSGSFKSFQLQKKWNVMKVHIVSPVLRIDIKIVPENVADRQEMDWQDGSSGLMGCESKHWQ